MSAATDCSTRTPLRRVAWHVSVSVGAGVRVRRGAAHRVVFGRRTASVLSRSGVSVKYERTTAPGASKLFQCVEKIPHFHAHRNGIACVGGRLRWEAILKRVDQLARYGVGDGMCAVRFVASRRGV